MPLISAGGRNVTSSSCENLRALRLRAAQSSIVILITRGSTFSAGTPIIEFVASAKSETIGPSAFSGSRMPGSFVRSTMRVWEFAGDHSTVAFSLGNRNSVSLAYSPSMYMAATFESSRTHATARVRLLVVRSFVAPMQFFLVLLNQASYSLLLCSLFLLAL